MKLKSMIYLTMALLCITTGQIVAKDYNLSSFTPMQKGKTRAYSLQVTINSTVTLSFGLNFDVEILDILPDGATAVKATITNASVDIVPQDDTPDAEGLADILSPMQQLGPLFTNYSIKAIISPTGDLTDIRGYEELVYKIGRFLLPPEEFAAIQMEHKAALDTVLASMVITHQKGPRLPQKPVTLGETWTQSYQAESAIEHYLEVINYTLMSVSDDFYDIEMEAKVVRTIDGQPSKQESATGLMHIERETGWLVGLEARGVTSLNDTTFSIELTSEEK